MNLYLFIEYGKYFLLFGSLNAALAVERTVTLPDFPIAVKPSLIVNLDSNSLPLEKSV